MKDIKTNYPKVIHQLKTKIDILYMNHKLDVQVYNELLQLITKLNFAHIQLVKNTQPTNSQE